MADETLKSCPYCDAILRADGMCPYLCEVDAKWTVLGLANLGESHKTFSHESDAIRHARVLALQHPGWKFVVARAYVWNPS